MLIEPVYPCYLSFVDMTKLSISGSRFSAKYYKKDLQTHIDTMLKSFISETLTPLTRFEFIYQTLPISYTRCGLVDSRYLVLINFKSFRDNFNLSFYLADVQLSLTR